MSGCYSSDEGVGQRISRIGHRHSEGALCNLSAHVHGSKRRPDCRGLWSAEMLTAATRYNAIVRQVSATIDYLILCAIGSECGMRKMGVALRALPEGFSRKSGQWILYSLQHDQR